MKYLLLAALALGLTQCKCLDMYGDCADHGKPATTDSAAALSTRDVHVDPEDKNTGLGSEVRLAYIDAVALIAFDTLPAIPAGKHLSKAELSLRGWTDTTGPAKVTFDLFRTGTDWEEGTGHWYYHTGLRHNGYQDVYANFPEYAPPAVTTDPKVRSGITWYSSTILRADMVKIATGTGILPQNQPAGAYPLLANTGAVTFDITGYLAGLADWSKPVSFGVRMAPPATGPNEGYSWLYARNHVQPAAYGPRLTVWYR